MAYRTPRLNILHALKTASGITSSAFDAAFPRERLLDDRENRLARFNVAAANQHVTIDRGAPTSGVDQIDRLIIPSGHNLNAVSIEVRVSADPPSWPGTLVHTFSGGTGLIDESFFAPTGVQHVRLIFTTSGQWEFGEVVFSKDRAPAPGPRPAWELNVESNYSETVMQSGERYAVVHGPEQRVLLLTWLGLDGADLVVFDDLRTATLGGAPVPFYLAGPDDSDPLLHVALSSPPELRQDSPDPQALGITYTVLLNAIEALG